MGISILPSSLVYASTYTRFKTNNHETNAASKREKYVVPPLITKKKEEKKERKRKNAKTYLLKAHMLVGIGTIMKPSHYALDSSCWSNNSYNHLNYEIHVIFITLSKILNP